MTLLCWSPDRCACRRIWESTAGRESRWQRIHGSNLCKQGVALCRGDATRTVTVLRFLCGLASNKPTNPHSTRSLPERFTGVLFSYLLGEIPSLLTDSAHRRTKNHRENSPRIPS